MLRLLKKKVGSTLPQGGKGGIAGFFSNSEMYREREVLGRYSRAFRALHDA
jgi:hypothetical protein